MGGTYIHWFQPHIWAEISRYNLEIQEVPAINKAHWITEGEVKSGIKEEMFEKINEGMEIFCEDGSKYFPRPYEPFYKEDNLKEIDQLSVEDRLEEIKPRRSQEIYDLIRDEWSAYFDTYDLSIPRLTQACRWGALAYNNWYMLEDIFELFKFKNGTKSLVDSIYNDSEAELKLPTAVSKVRKTEDSYTVGTRARDEFTAKAVVLTVSINVLNHIQFERLLAEEIHQLSDERQTTVKGGKL